MAWYEVLKPLPFQAYDQFTGPSAETLKAKKQIDEGWANLLLWGYVPKLYAHKIGHLQFEEYGRWAKAWEEGEQDPSSINAHISDLQAVVIDAKDYHGTEYPSFPTGPFDPSKAYVDSFDVEQGSAALKAAKAATDAAAATKKAIPWWVYPAVGVGALLLILGPYVPLLLRPRLAGRAPSPNPGEAPSTERKVEAVIARTLDTLDSRKRRKDRSSKNRSGVSRKNGAERPKPSKRS